MDCCNAGEVIGWEGLNERWENVGVFRDWVMGGREENVVDVRAVNSGGEMMGVRLRVCKGDGRV